MVLTAFWSGPCDLGEASRRTSTDAGWSSHLEYARISAPWSVEVWIQSIQGRRWAASTGPVAPMMSIGTRSQ